MSVDATNQPKTSNFIRQIIADDAKSGKFSGRVVTRFPPEPNGYLHIGHAKSIYVNFGTAAENSGGVCHLRFDDTNPLKEDQEYMDSIKEDINWLGYDWGENLYYASDYFEKLYQCAVELIKAGKAYVCSLSAEEVRTYRGTLTEPGKNSPNRDRSVAENLELFDKMRTGAFEDGAHTLRAKIDMSSGNINLRDPALYRIRHFHHYKTGDKWCIYPMYDFAHCVSDSIENITHSLCTLEFEDHRPLYDWLLNELKTENHPQQIEFARLNINYTITSKRKLRELVEGGHVDGWDDPRMPTLQGIRRRGYTPASLRNFCERIGVSKKQSIIDMGTLEECVRHDLEHTSGRALAVLDPLKVTIESIPEGHVELFNAPNHPKDETMGSRDIPFSREIYIERSDFMEDAPKKFFRLAPDREVRLRYGYVIRCNEVIKDNNGKVIELKCTHDPDTLGGKKPADGRKVKGIIHWVSTKHAIKAKVNVYDRLFLVPNPTEGEKEGVDFKTHLNPESLKTLTNCYLEPLLKNAQPEQAFQFERLGYFCLEKNSTPENQVFNRIATLKDAWAKAQKEQY